MSIDIEPEQFAELAGERVARNGIAGSLTYDRSNFSLLLKDGKGNVSEKLHLSSFYHDFQKLLLNPSERKYYRDL